ncbi:MULTISPECIES: ABC transporter permease [Actinomyces]|uniref:Glycine/betaine ABC transporter n=1 Tax=Actinomyces oris TaxID=544580 RepID=A0A1Q8WBC3_9ACTO|nr:MULTISPECIES: proline/glycine betaine ABC transporter permease [Actinomyces]MEA1305805.1 proline/glycine betaine ABC transporter permease [Actinomyces oris]OFR53372.1 glycine/betaine ABC transporter [Actinomyces sp. HMSC075C01]OLO54424.1 glycine/betaine ABC transporter [Actinomyces oris]OLO56362.1 glycine/betaine ABC transporter [Actinomyces oris]OLO61128.1 glycine/betaine ABC transporter [Actinomyces oris]
MIPVQTPLPKIPLGTAVEVLIEWIQVHLHGFLSAISRVGTLVNDNLVDLLLAVPPLLMVVVFVLIAWMAKSWRLAVGTAITFLIIISLGQWVNAMETLVLVTLATLTALVFAIPLGIWAARNKYVSILIRPVLDLMQTMPAFVYLIPSVLFFSIGVVPGMFATLIFAMPPGVRMTELGIKQVDKETVEAGRSFGATDWQILRGIQLPLAVPTIMAGVNQVIMLALSMAVIAGMVGADGLGKEVVKALATIDIAKGTEAGLSIVFLAIYLDRVTAALGAPREKGSLLSLIKKR